VDTFYDDQHQSHWIAVGARSGETGFVAPVAALVLDRPKVWAAADFHILAFDIQADQVCALLYVGDPNAVRETVEVREVIVTRSVLALFQQMCRDRSL
jgi:hypothetical protein